MNIFACDDDPIQAAKALPDVLVNKMTLETAQILCDVMLDVGAQDVPYKHTTGNKEPARWARVTRGNFKWLTAHGLALAREYTARYSGKHHASERVIFWCGTRAAFVSDGPLQPFTQCMPDAYRIPGDAVSAYRRYLECKPDHYKCIWTPPGRKPDWWQRWDV